LSSMGDILLEEPAEILASILPGPPLPRPTGFTMLPP
jgi:hypothetical protein